MAQNSKHEVVSISQADQKNDALRLQTEVSASTPLSAENAAHLTMALSHLEGRYRANVKAYAQELHACNQQIEVLKSQKATLLQEKEPESKRLSEVEKEIEHQTKMLTYLHQQWMQKCTVVTELKRELQALTVDSDAKSKALEGRYVALDTLSEEIESLEVSLLEHELERQNLMLKLEPVEQKIRAIEQEIDTLEAQKRYIESAHLHHITDLQQGGNEQLATPQLEQKA